MIWANVYESSGYPTAAEWPSAAKLYIYPPFAPRSLKMDKDAGEQVAAEMRAKVYERTGLTCSCGVAPNRMLAKVCSDINKPNGQCCIPADPHHIRTFVDDLPTRKIPGIGKVTLMFKDEPSPPPGGQIQFH